MDGAHANVQHFIGGNSLENAPPSRVTDFVRSHGGHSVISKILIANNGIAAVKEIRSVRKWCYETFGDERAVEFTAMATPEDLKVNADYIRMADRFVEVPGGTNNNNYANVDLIVDVAERAGVHAVWAGWGHASENPRLPEMLAASKQKIVFIGPPGSAMRSLGDKISSTIVAQHAQVPCMPWSGTGITDTVMSPQGFVTVPDGPYQDACVKTVDDGEARAEKIGYPVMIKASEGGGGKGIRMVHERAAFQQSFHAVAAEVPGSPIFIMALAGSARHLEVQLLADQYGNAISLFGRDCSVQRRHQKIIEEAPVTIAKAERFEEMEKAAVRLAKLVGYVSAGTVEYLYSHADDSFFFLELNPRLQVEHPTTEMVSGVNLPAAQLQIAMGIPLSQIRDIRTLYGLDPHTTSEIDFDFVNPESVQVQRKPKPKGHVVACRITSENPEDGFKPSGGDIQELNFRSNTNVWGYFSVGAAGGIHSFADSQFGHVFAYGSDRPTARKNMVIALKELSIRGDFRTTVEYLITLLETSDFEQNTITTAWLDGLISKKLTSERPDTNLAVICGAVVKAHAASEACWAEYRRILDKGQVPSKDTLKTVFSFDFIYDGVRYNFTAARGSETTYRIFVNGGKTIVGIRPLADGGMLVLLDGRSHTLYWREDVGTLRVQVDAKTCLIEQENDPTQLRSPSPGKLVKFLVESGDHVNAGDVYAEIEVMKMIMPLVAAEAGLVQFVKQVGVTVDPGAIIGILQLDDPSRVKKARPFEGLLPDMGLPNVVGTKPHQRLQAQLDSIYAILNGYESDASSAILRSLFEILQDPELAFGEATSVLSTLSGRMPADLEDDIRAAISSAQAKDGADFPATKILKQIERYIDNARPQDKTTIRLQVQPIQELASKNVGGTSGYAAFIFSQILEQYLSVESIFAMGSEEAVVLTLRDEKRDSLNDVLALVLSHSRLAGRSKLILSLLEHVKSSGLVHQNERAQLQQILKSLADLPAKLTQATKVSLKAREILISSSLPSYEERRLQMEKILVASVTTSYYGESGGGHRSPSIDILAELSNSRFTVYDVLSSFFKHNDPWIVLAALTCYVLRAYREYSILDIQHEEGEHGAAGAIIWRFKLNQTTPEASTPRVDSTRDVYRVGSMSDLTYKIKQSQTEPLRTGVMTSFNNLAEVQAGFRDVLSHYSAQTAEELTQRYGKDAAMHNVLNVAIRAFESADDMPDADWQIEIAKIVEAASAELNKRGIRRVTFLVCRQNVYPSYFTYRQEAPGGPWKEEEKIRNIEPALASQLELGRLSNFNVTPIFVDNRQIHIYKAEGKENSSDVRFFIRALVRPGRLQGSMRTAEYLISECDRLVTDIMDALEVVGADARNADCNHVGINFIYNVLVDFDDVQEALAGFIERHGRRLWRLRITAAEIRMVLEDDEGNVTPIRCCIENVSGFVVKYHAYQEIETEKGATILKSIGEAGPFHLQPVNHPYMTKNSLQPRRYQAHLVGTTYVYDYPDLFVQSLRKAWAEAAAKIPGLRVPSEPLTSAELVLDENNELQEVDRPPGSNSCGMVAWIFTMLTPEYPKGRRVVVIANDITFKIGSFGPREDDYFYKATEIAKKRGLPRIYLSANSGARLGIAEELLNLFQAAFVDPADPLKGVKYLYLTPDTLATLAKKGSSVITEEIEEDGERRHRITDIVGLQDGLGVESLRGSGLIAGATSRAYDEGIFTISLVTARSVGIGAYLVRLGQRAIQVEGNPLILTGTQALNKVLGREVYTSNLQLGGTQIMARNGTTHLIAESDLDGALKVIKWLAYVPDRKGKAIPISPSQDSWDRPVTYSPPKGPYDPRWLIEGQEDEGLTGLFDKGSFFEVLGEWAKTIVCGRARLGGIPVGVIAVETRTTERVVPADPANPSGFEQKIMEAGQVWTPNSAYKTAQAINDIDREGLPLIFLTNMRGFSGGQQDMYDEILKQGSKIVDGLSSFKQPIFIYIVPNGELRGGAWVVLDPTINDAKMEMYADVESRGGILEPDAIVAIKLRKDKIAAMMNRLDSKYPELKKATEDASLSAEDRTKAGEELAKREKLLAPTYAGIANLYADLHDRVGRMEAKGCAKRAVWRESRRFFYWRLRRRIDEEHLLSQIATANPDFTLQERRNALLSITKDVDFNDDRALATWIESSSAVIAEGVSHIRAAYVASRIVTFASDDRQGALQGLTAVLSTLDQSEKSALVASLGL